MTLFAIDAVLQENTPSLIAFCFIDLIILIRVIFAVIFNIFTVILSRNVLLMKWEYLVVAFVTIVFSCIYVALIYPLYRSFGLVAVEFIGIEKKLIRKNFLKT
jgi:hypothetical protein